MSSSAPTIIYLGLDVHKDSVTIAVLPADATAPTRIDKYPNDFAKLRRVCERHAKDGTLRACYEASGAGYVLQRAMQGWGYHCDVIAPSLIPTKPGVQRKHDKYDAGQLARLYRAGELTTIRIPSEAEERVRDVVRCRETLQREAVKSRHYILDLRLHHRWQHPVGPQMVEKLAKRMGVTAARTPGAMPIKHKPFSNSRSQVPDAEPIGLQPSGQIDQQSQLFPHARRCISEPRDPRGERVEMRGKLIRSQP